MLERKSVRAEPVAQQSAAAGQAPVPTRDPGATQAERAEHDAAAHEDLWRAVQRAIRAQVEPEQFATWFQRARIVAADAERIRIAVQNDFSRDWLERYYQKVIAQAAREILGAPRAVEIVVVPELALPAPRREPDPRREAAPADDAAEDARSAHVRLPGAAKAGHEAARGAGHGATVGPGFNGELGLNPKYTFDNFVVGPCNRFAHAAAMGAAEQPGRAYNPFFLHGSVGLGKTHLLQSLCFTILARDPKARILYLSCETFVNHFINSLENGDVQKFRHKYRNVDVLVVDDIQVLANKERTQEEFFHTFNTLYQLQKQIVLSSDSPPKDIPTLQERLVSRFKWGLVTEIEPPCYETRMAILKRKSRERGRELPDDVASLLAERIESNIRELEGAVTKLLGFANVSRADLTADFAREVLRDLFTERRSQPAMGDILALVTEAYDVKLSDLQSKKRTQAVVLPRQVAMFLARRITRHSLEEIGGFFGGRDHSTVLYAIDKIDTLAASDPAMREQIDGFLARLAARPA